MVWEKVMPRCLQITLFVLFFVGSATASDQELTTLMDSMIFYDGSATAPDQNLEMLMDRGELRETIRAGSGGTLLDETTVLEQARIQARSRSEYGLELRPGISEEDVRLALRVYLPDRWSKKRLREQLALATQSEQLRVAALEWQDIVAVYRDFCVYRMLRQQLALLENELQFMQPYLAQADQSVALSQLTISDRARLYSTYLALLNQRNELENALLDFRQRLKMVLGPNADLENLSVRAVITMPSQLEIESLLRSALEKRADYRLLNAEVRAMQLAEEAARSEDGFRLKYIQPAYSVDYNDGGSGWELSASLVLPWGTRNPDIAVYRSQQALSLAAQAEQRRIIADRLRILLDTAEAHYTQIAEQNRRIQPIIRTLNADMKVLTGFPLEQMRDVFSLRERILDASLQAAESTCRTETLAVDLAEELGAWQ
jgi:hypothetical protein